MAPSIDNTGGRYALVCWLLDTRSLWPAGRDNNIWNAAGGSEAMALLSTEEQKTVSSKMFLPDAKMSLASALLKRLFISKALDIPWNNVIISRKNDRRHGKPCAVDTAGRPIEGIDFNVSHQAGLVTLIGWDGKQRHEYGAGGDVQGLISSGAHPEQDVMVGTDIVCVNERDDYRTIDSEGLDSWIDIYDFVFSDEERWTMKYDVDYVTLLDGTILQREELGRHDRCIQRDKIITVKASSGQTVRFNSDLLIEAKLRRFYTFFCYKEAYIKLAGEALLAPWLKQLEFSNVRSPRPGSPARCSTDGQWGEEITDVETHLNGAEVSDVKMKIQAFEEQFMIATAIQGNVSKLQVPAFQKLDIKADVLRWAQKHTTGAPSDDP
ncbi:putative phosphopantetheinyl transferase [Dissoconium aciculare CBS 342.82]|uniref:holo-[acyl-carrier-protein] synthase n=1 Tax=Dissoconium aciculare CBS 342.82 TaxID=1314786 RepID=A0A6J3M2R6_9PEZI|nr:putative phosphopantetheinyl transferase [Dissoconium aciculare CBS 342.82]KAF1822321.1 putative phosphopantetheinyl transferase [Dissoconium aciculare CBS 342.82]